MSFAGLDHWVDNMDDELHLQARYIADSIILSFELRQVTREQSQKLVEVIKEALREIKKQGESNGQRISSGG